MLYVSKISPMISITLALCFVSALSSNVMLSMLLFLVLSYITAALWLIQHKLLYSGIIYVLVYVGAIVVLFIFVIQLTSTTINATSVNNNSLISNYLSMIIMLLLAYLVIQSFTTVSTELLLYISNNNMSDNVLIQHDNLLSNTSVFATNGVAGNINNIKLLAQELFTEYAYVLIITIHAIVLSIIGAIPLALSK
jgi:NADH:ubiquinone oxidoreductase subunit 6 (subunit J)